MEKQIKTSVINKKLLCTDNQVNIAKYEDFAMKILNKSEKGTNVFAITCDKNNFNLIPTATINVAYNLALHNKKVLVINCDTQNLAFNNLLATSNNNDIVVNYSNFDIILPVNTDFMNNLTLDELKEKYPNYDYIILCVPSPKCSLNYLAVPQGTPFYMLVIKFISSFYAINKCIGLLNNAELSVIGSVYVKLK